MLHNWYNELRLWKIKAARRNNDKDHAPTLYAIVGEIELGNNDFISDKVG